MGEVVNTVPRGSKDRKQISFLWINLFYTRKKHEIRLELGSDEMDL